MVFWCHLCITITTTYRTTITYEAKIDHLLLIIHWLLHLNLFCPLKCWIYIVHLPICAHTSALEAAPHYTNPYPMLKYIMTRCGAEYTCIIWHSMVIYSINYHNMLHLRTITTLASDIAWHCRCVYSCSRWHSGLSWVVITRNFVVVFQVVPQIKVLDMHAQVFAMTLH